MQKFNLIYNICNGINKFQTVCLLENCSTARGKGSVTLHNENFTFAELFKTSQPAMQITSRYVAK